MVYPDKDSRELKSLTSNPLWKEAEAEELEKFQEYIRHFREETPCLQDIQEILYQTGKGSSLFEFKSSLITTWDEIEVFVANAKEALAELEKKAQEEKQSEIATAKTEPLSEEETNSKPTEEETKNARAVLKGIKPELTPLLKAFDERRSYADARYISKLQENQKGNSAKQSQDTEQFFVSDPQTQQDDDTVTTEGKALEKSFSGYEFRGETGDTLRLITDDKKNICKAELPSPNRPAWQLILPDIILPKQRQLKTLKQNNIRDIAAGWAANDPGVRKRPLSIHIQEFKTSDPGHLGSAFAETLYYLLRLSVEWRASSEKKDYAVTFMSGLLEAGFDPNKIKLTDSKNHELEPEFKAMVLEAARNRLSSQLEEDSSFLPKLSDKIKEMLSKISDKIKEMMPLSLQTGVFDSKSVSALTDSDSSSSIPKPGGR